LPGPLDRFDWLTADKLTAYGLGAGFTDDRKGQRNEWQTANELEKGIRVAEIKLVIRRSAKVRTDPLAPAKCYHPRVKNC
jgi:hypothetical protein